MTPDRQQAIGKRVRHEGSAALASCEVAFGVQLIVGEAHRVARDVEIIGERARGGQARSSSEAAVDNRAAKTVVELSMQRRRVSGIERDEGVRWVRRTSRRNGRWHPSPGAVWFFFDFTHV